MSVTVVGGFRTASSWAQCVPWTWWAAAAVNYCCTDGVRVYE